MRRETTGGITRYLSGAARPASPASAASPAKPAAERAPLKISPHVAAALAGRGGPNETRMPAAPLAQAFAPATHPRSVEDAVDEGDRMAMDQDVSTYVNATVGLFSGDWIGALFAEGQAFLGFPYLAILAQRAEYRRMAERFATEMTRRWIKVKASGDDDLTDDVKAIEEELDRLGARLKFREAAEHDNFFGRGHIFMDLGTGKGLDDKELATPIGDGRDAASQLKIEKNSLKRLAVIEPVWLYPMSYDTRDPTSEDWYRPTQWNAQGKMIDASRILTFVGREVPDMLKPAYSFGGLSLTQMAKPYVDNWLRTRQAIADLVQSFSVSGLMTDLSAVLAGGEGDIVARVDLYNQVRSNRGMMLLDKDREEFFNVSTPLGGLDHLQAQSLENLAAVSGIPLIILLGITPSGLNASSDGEIQAFHDQVHAHQELLFGDNVRTLLRVVQMSLFGEVRKEIGFEFVPLGGLNEKEIAEIRKIDSDRASAMIADGVISPAEERARIAKDESTNYPGIDPEDVPDVQEGEEGDLEPGEPDDDLDPDGGEEGDTRAADSDFSEADHPRAPDGKFGQGSGSGIKSTPTKELSSFRKSTIKSLTEHGLKTGTEALAMFDLKANRPVEGGGAESSDKHVAMTPEMMEKLRDGAVAYEVHHNHPGGGSLSGMDLAMVAHYPGIKRLYAHGDDGSSFAVAGVPRDVSDRAGQVHRLSERLLGRQAALSAGDRDLLKSHLANLALQNTGWVRDYEAHLSPKMESLTKTAIAKGVLAKLIDNNKPFARKAAGMATDAWEESSHPRDAGRFSSKPGSKGQKAAAASSTAPEAGKPAPSGADAPKGLGKVVEGGPDMGRLAAHPADKMRGYTPKEMDWEYDVEYLKYARSAFPDAFASREDFQTKFDAAPLVALTEKQLKGLGNSMAAQAIGRDEGWLLDTFGHRRDPARILDDLRHGQTAPPIVLKSGDRLRLMAGQTRLAVGASQGVSVPVKVIDVTRHAHDKEWDETLHPRDGGKFASKPGAGAAEKPDGGKAKKSAFGGLFKVTGKGEKADHDATVKHVLSKGPNAGSSYRQMLESLVKSGPKHGTSDVDLGKLKEHLFKAYDMASNKLLEMYGSADGPEQEKIKKLIAAAVKKQKALGVAPQKQDLGSMAGQPAPKLNEVPQQSTGAAKAIAEGKQNFAASQGSAAASKTGPDAVKAKFLETNKGKSQPPISSAKEKVKAGALVGASAADIEATLSSYEKKAVAADYHKNVASMLESAKKHLANAPNLAAQKVLQEAKLKQEAEKIKADLADPETAAHYEVLGKLGAGYVLEEAKHRVKKAGLDGVVTPYEASQIVAYTGSHYGPVNKQLRSGAVSKEQWAYARALNAALSKLPKSPGVSVRGTTLPAEELARYQVGMVVEERAFTSTGVGKKFSGPHTFEIHGKTGRDVSMLSQFPGEKEVLFPSASRFEVVSREGNHIVLKEVDYLHG